MKGRYTVVHNVFDLLLAVIVIHVAFSFVPPTPRAINRESGWTNTVFKGKSKIAPSFLLLPSRDRLRDQDEDPPSPVIGFDGADLALTRTDVESLTVLQLKQQLRLRGLKVSGRKKELQDRLLAFSSRTQKGEESYVRPDVVVDSPDDVEQSQSEAHRFAQERGKELIDIAAYLDDDEKGQSVRSTKKADDLGEEDGLDSLSSGPEVWGSEAKIVDDYEGRQVVVDNLSRTIVEFKGSNQTYVKAFVVASRDALKAFLKGGDRGNNQTSTAEETLREIQRKREAAARIPVRFEEDEGLDEGDETGLYKNIIERDFSDWGKFTQTGAQLSASEVQGVLLLSDVYGAFADDTRFLAEKIAFECQPVVVMVPDLFRGMPWREDKTKPGLNEEGESYEQWRATHSDLRVSVDIRAAAACLRERYGVSAVAVWGTCYGGGRALEAASGYFPNDSVHDVDGSIGPPPVDPMAVVAWYPTRYDAKTLFGREHKGTKTTVDGEMRTTAVMAIFAGNDVIAGATPEDAADLQSLLKEDDRIKDYMIKVFPGKDHGFAHIGLSTSRGREEADFEEFVDQEFGGAGRVAMDGSDAEVACLLSTAWMETYTRVFLPTTGPAVSKDENEVEWRNLDMKNSRENKKDVRSELKDALESFVDEPLGGRRIDQTDESQKEELAKILRAMSEDQEGPYAISADDDLATIYAKLKTSDENFQIF